MPPCRRLSCILLPVALPTIRHLISTGLSLGICGRRCSGTAHRHTRGGATRQPPSCVIVHCLESWVRHLTFCSPPLEMQMRWYVVSHMPCNRSPPFDPACLWIRHDAHIRKCQAGLLEGVNCYRRTHYQYFSPPAHKPYHYSCAFFALDQMIVYLPCPKQ